jgi:hypothetical protein
VTVLGAMNWGFIITEAIRESFASFDEIKAGIAPLLEDLLEQHSETVVAEPGRRIVGDVWCVGWSDERQGPDGFTIGIDKSLDEFNELVAAGNSGARRPFSIDMLGPLGINWHPSITAEQLFEARIPVSAGTDRLTEIDLLQILEVQRRIPFDKVAGAFCVGGYALLTTVNQSGVTQRRVHDWDEDEVGALITPAPIDWVRWRAERISSQVATNVTSIAAAGLNRHQRRQQRAMRR